MMTKPSPSTLKIVLTAETYHPIQNGVVASMDSFKKAFESMGQRVLIVAPQTGPTEDDATVLRVRAIHAFRPQPDYGLALPSQTTYQRIADFRPDIVHAQHMFRMGDLAIKIARRLNVPVVYTYHTKIQDYVHHVPFGRWPIIRSLLVRSLIRYSVRFCNRVDQVVTPSRVIKDELERAGVKTPITVIPTGINLAEFSAGERTERRSEILKTYNIPTNHRLLLYVSRLEPEKNVPLLLEAFAKIRANFPRVSLLMVGGGSATGDLKKRAGRLKISPAVRFIGQLPIEKTRAFFVSADVFVFPSKTETQGIVIVEAMAGGLPVVAVNEGGPTEFVSTGQNGFLVPDHAGRFAEAVLKLLNNDRLYETMRRIAFANAKNFSSKAMAERLIALYRQLIERQNETVSYG